MDEYPSSTSASDILYDEYMEKYEECYKKMEEIEEINKIKIKYFLLGGLITIVINILQLILGILYLTYL